MVPQPVLDQGEVPAEGLRQVGVDGGELDPQPGEADEVQPATAGRGRHAQRTEALGLEQAHRLHGQLPVHLALEGTLGDGVEDGRPLGEEVVGGTAGPVPGVAGPVGPGGVVGARGAVGAVGPALGGPDTQGGHG